MDSMKNMDLEPVQKTKNKSNFILDRITIFAITSIVITELIITNGKDADTAWLFIAYGVFYLLRICAFLIKDGSLRLFIDD